MNDKEKINPFFIQELSTYKRAALDALVQLLISQKSVHGIMIGGSITYKQDISRSDIDLFCITGASPSEIGLFCKMIKSFQGVAAIVDQGHYPWTGQLYTLFYEEDPDFSIDLGLVPLGNVTGFFWEPQGYVLFDPASLIKRSRTEAMASKDFSMQPFIKKNPFSAAIIALKKIEKNLLRGHLWNAMEQLNLFRRAVMEIIRVLELRNTDFLGRVDREIEDVLPNNINMQLVLSVAAYDKKDISVKTVHLSEMLTDRLHFCDQTHEAELKPWFAIQLDHERKKLIKYHLDA